MKLASLAKKANTEYDKAKSSAEGVITHLIVCGEYITQAKKQANGSWEDWVSDNLNFNRAQSSKYMRIAKHKAQAAALVHENGDMSIDNLTKLLPKTNEAVIAVAVDADSLAYVGSKPVPTSQTYDDKDDWRTPGKYIESARKVMGSIDLDPFSSIGANVDVNATRFFDIGDNALVCEWADPETRTVWMNPPYGRGMVNKAVDKFLEEYNKGAFKSAIVLVNNATDTHWFYDMGIAADGICFTHGRIQFIAGDKLFSSNTRGQAFFYFGKEFETFKAEFGQYGLIYKTGGE